MERCYVVSTSQRQAYRALWAQWTAPDKPPSALFEDWCIEHPEVPLDQKISRYLAEQTTH